MPSTPTAIVLYVPTLNSVGQVAQFRAQTVNLTLRSYQLNLDAGPLQGIRPTVRYRISLDRPDSGPL